MLIRKENFAIWPPNTSWRRKLKPGRRMLAPILRPYGFPAGPLSSRTPNSQRGKRGAGTVLFPKRRRRRASSRLEKRGIVERLDHGVHHVGGAVILPFLQQLPHLAQIGAHRRLQRRIALDQGPRDAEGDAFGAHPGLLDGGFAHGRLLVEIKSLTCW